MLAVTHHIPRLISSMMGTPHRFRIKANISGQRPKSPLAQKLHYGAVLDLVLQSTFEKICALGAWLQP